MLPDNLVYRKLSVPIEYDYMNRQRTLCEGELRWDTLFGYLNDSENLVGYTSTLTKNLLGQTVGALNIITEHGMINLVLLGGRMLIQFKSNMNEDIRPLEEFLRNYILPNTILEPRSNNGLRTQNDIQAGVRLYGY